MKLSRAKLQTTLAKVIVKAFSRLGVQQEELLTGPIGHVDLIWQTPPLITESKFGGLPLHEYMDIPSNVRTERLYSFWVDAMMTLRSHPHRVIGEMGYRGLSKALWASSGERLYRFSIPEGFPQHTTEYAGVILSLECAHVLRHSAAISRLVESADDYFVVTHDGYEVGVRDGLPIVAAEQWDIPVHGLVPDLLRMPRGDVFEGCDYDIISKLRSALIDHKDRVAEFDGIDWALQTLRVLAKGTSPAKVLSAVQSMRSSNALNIRRLQVAREALALMPLLAMSDRQKIETLKAMLVPELMGSGTFSNTIFPYYKLAPPTLQARVMERVTEALRRLVEKEEDVYAIKV